MSVLGNGDVQIVLKKKEVKWLLEWVETIIDTEKDSEQKEFLFYAEKLKFLLKGGN